MENKKDVVKIKIPKRTKKLEKEFMNSFSHSMLVKKPNGESNQYLCKPPFRIMVFPVENKKVVFNTSLTDLMFDCESHGMCGLIAFLDVDNAVTDKQKENPKNWLVIPLVPFGYLHDIDGINPDFKEIKEHSYTMEDFFNERTPVK